MTPCLEGLQFNMKNPLNQDPTGRNSMGSKINPTPGHLVPPIDPKNTNLLEDVEIFRPVKFCWIQFSGFRGEIENASANHRPGRLSCSSDRPEKHKRDRRRWDLASCEFCWIPFICFRGEGENVSANQKPDGHLVFPIGRKNPTLVEDV